MAQDGATQERVHASLVQVNGPGVLWLLLVPVALAGAGFRASFARGATTRVVRWVAAIGLLGFSVAGMLSIGLF